MCFDTQGPVYVLLPPKRHMCPVDTLRYISACPQKPVDLALEVTKGTITKSREEADLSANPEAALPLKSECGTGSGPLLRATSFQPLTGEQEAEAVKTPSVRVVAWVATHLSESLLCLR